MSKVSFILAIISVTSLIACSDPSGAKKAAEDSGLIDVQTTGYSWFSCSDSDTFSTGFTATNPQGKRVHGVVCSGWLKGATVRFF